MASGLVPMTMQMRFIGCSFSLTARVKIVVACHNQLEALVAMQVLNVAFGAGEQVVRADDLASTREQAIDQMRTQEAGPAGEQDAFAGAVFADGHY